MTEYATVYSFIIRLYRADTQDPRKIVGLAEALDGSGARESFIDLDGLGAIVHRYAGDGGAESAPAGLPKNKRPKQAKEEK